MSCNANGVKSGQALKRNGISTTSGQNSFLAGGQLPTIQVSFFEQGTKSMPDETSSQVSFFDLANQKQRFLPDRRGIGLEKHFTSDELQRLSVQLRLGAAATERHIRELTGGMERGPEYSDPRPLDWARLDQKQYRFLIEQLTAARRGRGVLDISALKLPGLVDLWDFSRYEAERALRNVEYLRLPGGPISGPTSDYLIGNHKLLARFYSHLATQLETRIPPEELEAAKAWE
jgi:hypothetical protein